MALPDWLVLDAEYRVQSIYINPLDLNGEDVTEAIWTEQRLRLDLGFKWPKIGGVFIQADVLGGMFGDNGAFGKDPSSNEGLSLASKNPNNVGWEVGLRPGADPLNPASYIPVLHGLEPIRINLLYGEVYLPIGVIRVGRQVLTEGATIAGHDGDRRNRWGVSRYNDVADRVLFATKIDELVKVIQHGKGYKPDPSQNNGVILAFTYDWNSQDEIVTTRDDGHQVNVFLSWRREKADWLGAKWRNFELAFTFVYKGHPEFDTQVFATPLRFTSRIGPAYINIQFSLITGHTREISEGVSKISGSMPTRQDLLQFGLHTLFEYKVGPVTLGLEFDLASGDDDPRGNTDVTQFSFAKDFNVGLLMFEHLMAFQTARSAAVGIHNLRQLNAASFPLTEVASKGRFQNAYALFPQVKWDILEGPSHFLHLRLGVLAAWPAKGVVDPVGTLLAEDGLEISDDAVNFHGGKPGTYYGTEVDLQIEWTWKQFFTWTIEGAVFFPGDAVQDANGDAVTSFLIENRFVFQF